MKLIPWWLKALAIFGLLAAVIGGWQWREAVVDQRGYDRAVAERKQQDDAELAAATTKARAAEQALRTQIDADSATRFQEKQTYENTIADLRLAARRGTIGMRAPATCLPANPAPTDSAAAGRPGAAEDPSLLPEAVATILDVAGGSAKDVRDYNALIDLYNQVRATCNAP